MELGPSMSDILNKIRLRIAKANFLAGVLIEINGGSWEALPNRIVVDGQPLQLTRHGYVLIAP